MTEAKFRALLGEHVNFRTSGPMPLRTTLQHLFAVLKLDVAVGSCPEMVVHAASFVGVPLSQVLDEISGAAGQRWRTAVHSNAQTQIDLIPLESKN